MQYDNIPVELKSERRFVCFDIGKKPMNSITGGYASSTDKNTWGSFEEAIEGVKKYGFAGIGFVLGDGFFGVDIDTASTPGLDIISPEGTEIIGLMDSYTERSISGYGFHIIGKQSGVELPFNKIEITPNGIIRPDIDSYTKKQKLNPDGSLKFKKPELEIYTEGRYFTLTGNVFGKTNPINERSEELKKLVEKYKDFVKLNVTTRVPNNNVKPIKTIEEALLLDKVLSDYWNGKRPSGDESRDDMGFLSKLLYWCDANVDVAIEAFMESPYAAQKDEQHSTKIERVDYLLRTANKAMPITTAAMLGKNIPTCSD